MKASASPVVGRDEKIQFLKRIIETPADDVDKSSDLCHGYTRVTTKNGDGTHTVRTKYKTPCKVAAARELARMLGRRASR